MLKPRILVTGNACTEFIMRTSRLPEPGESLSAERFLYQPGGRGVCTAVASVRLGADCLLCAKVGDDPNAKDLTEYLDAEKIDARFVTRERGENTALDVIIKENGTEDRRIGYPGASERLLDTDVEESFISYPDAVILHPGIPPQAADEVVKLASVQKIPLFVMSAPADPSVYAISRLAGCEIFSANEAETVAFTGISPSDQEKCMKACLAFMQQVKAKYIVLRLGERGYFLYDGMYYSFISAYDVPQPAGVSSEDAFAAALVLEYLRSEGDIKRSCEFAAIVSAIYLTRGGGLRAYPSDEEVKRFILRNEIDFKYSEETE